MHTFGMLTLTWTLTAAQNFQEKRNVAVAPRQDRLGARTKCTGMCLAVVHVISNKTLRDHLADFSCFNMVHSDDAVMVSAASAHALSSLDHYCIILVHAH